MISLSQDTAIDFASLPSNKPDLERYLSNLSI